MTTWHFRKLITLCAMVTMSLSSTIALGVNSTNCDIRKLDLTPMQKTKMRLIRVQYRNTLNNFHHLPNSRNSNEKLANILMQPNLEEARVQHYILERYSERMQQDINELKVQHTFLQVLNHQQRQDWINNCLR